MLLNGYALGILALCQHNVMAAITLDLSSVDSIKQAAEITAKGMLQYYSGNNPGDVPGNLPDPYYWWEAGAMFGALIDYWYFTGDDQFNEITMQAMLHQTGPNADYMPLNQTKALGNDDQAFWGMAAMSAAENRFPNPPSDKPQWLALAQAIFNLQAARWDMTTCGGGLKWQIFQFNGGYEYKNTISNGAFFNIGARLAMYTGNDTYAEWAEKTWDWSRAIRLIDERYNFYDGSDDRINCTELDHMQWSYNAGVFLVGAANMYNYTGGSPVWEERIRGIISNLPIFLHEGTQVLTEIACESYGTCNVDQRSFKAYLSRWMAATMVRAPFTYDLLKPILSASAMAAVSTCNGGNDGNQCGHKWYTGTFDGQTGVGEQMCALEVIQSHLIDIVPGPATAQQGGISEGNPNAGTTSPVDTADLIRLPPMTTADKVGGAFVTIGLILLVVGTCWWLIH